VSTEEFPQASPASNVGELIALTQRFTTIIRAETASLRSGDLSRFETLAACKREHFEALRQSLAILEPLRASVPAAEREHWREAAATCETALHENARLIEAEQVHAAALLEEWRAAMQRRMDTMLTYGRDARARLKP
jgi:hypothetical protein